MLIGQTCQPPPAPNFKNRICERHPKIEFHRVEPRMILETSTARGVYFNLRTNRATPARGWCVSTLSNTVDELFSAIQRDPIVGTPRTPPRCRVFFRKYMHARAPSAKLQSKYFARPTGSRSKSVCRSVCSRRGWHRDKFETIPREHINFATTEGIFEMLFARLVQQFPPSLPRSPTGFHRWFGVFCEGRSVECGLKRN